MDNPAEVMDAAVVFWSNPSTGKVHTGARIGRGPLLTSEACQHDQAGEDVVEYKSNEFASIAALDPCRICTTPALEV